MFISQRSQHLEAYFNVLLEGEGVLAGTPVLDYFKANAVDGSSVTALEEILDFVKNGPPEVNTSKPPLSRKSSPRVSEEDKDESDHEE